MKAASKALEINLRDSRVEVTLDPKYTVLRDIASQFHGILERLDSFLKEVCHPYKNRRFIVTEARSLGLNYFHLFRDHPGGPKGASLFVDIFLEALAQAKEEKVRADAADHLLTFLHKIISDSGRELARFAEPLRQAFLGLHGLDQDRFRLIRRSFYQINGLAVELDQRALPGLDFAPMEKLLLRYLEETFSYWLDQVDPLTWFVQQTGQERLPDVLPDLFEPVSHKRLSALKEALVEIKESGKGARERALDLAGLPGYRQLVAEYEKIPRLLAGAGQEFGQGDQWELVFLFHIMSLSGLSPIHERSLDRINRTLSRIIDSQGAENVQGLIADTFRILRTSFARFPQTALHSSLKMGRAVYGTQDGDLLEFFNAGIINLGFHSPGFQGVGEDWDIKVNHFHVENIRTWLRLMELNPRSSTKLISALIVNIALGGVLIKDTDLFPRDITRLLNSDITPVYNLIKQLCRLFPTYFNEIGAEGRLREISTQIDELAHRRDVPVHFLRKQSHVQSSPLTVDLMEGLFRFWLTRDKAPLAELIPERILGLAQSRGEQVDGLHALMKDLVRSGLIKEVPDLLRLGQEDLQAWLKQTTKGRSLDRRRLALAHELYGLLHQKYHSDLIGLEDHLDRLMITSFPDLGPLKKALAGPDLLTRINTLLDYLEKLKQIILSPKAFPAREDIYHKRHVAVDIPSMYGSYHEAKFDALGLTLRLESLANTLLQELIDGLDLNLITRATLVRLHDYLNLFSRVLALDGIASQELASQLDLLAHSLTIRGFSFTQYLDVFSGFAKVVGNMVGDNFTNIHHNQLVNVINQAGSGWVLPRYLERDPAKPARDQVLRISEIFLRDRIAGSLGLQQLDQLISRVMATFFQQRHKLPPRMLRLVLDYDPSRTTTPIDPVKEELSDVIHLGAKGFNLVRIKARGLPVPPGFIVTTEAFKCREVLETYEPARENFRERIFRQLAGLERLTGKKFGDPRNPLLLSVRSGSSISQPGMLLTFLNVGINEEIVEGMASSAQDRTWFAWDCYRRYLQCSAMARGLARDEFDAIMAAMKDKFDLPLKQNFSGAQMRECALAYKGYIQSSGVPLEEDPRQQLETAVWGVLDSWNSRKAKTYRRIMGISDDWGTAVTVQAMVFGNLSLESGSGVFFTHNPRWAGDRFQLWGDFTLGNQGEDVVSGLVQTRPLNRRQAEIERRVGGPTLESAFPGIYQKLKESAQELIDQGGYSPQEMEFTFEGPRASDLFFLQSRDMDLRNQTRAFDWEKSDLPPGRLLGHGIGVSGGTLTGRLVFDLEEITSWRKKRPGRALILARNDTVPDDINEINEADGLLTARGGSTSHAAIVAHRLLKTCVVGVKDMVCDEQNKTCLIGRESLCSGALISINGREGSIYLHPDQESGKD